MFKSDILFSGYYGRLNTGDDAFVEVTSYAAKKIWLKKKVKYSALKRKLPLIIQQNKGYPISIPYSYNIQDKILVKNTDAYIAAGGSIFNSEISKNSARHVAYLRKINKDNNFKLGAIGVSLGPFKNTKAEKSIVEYLKVMDFLALRDQRSFEFADSLNLPYNPIQAFDLAAILPDIYKEARAANTNKKKIIGISLCLFESIIGKNISNEKRRNGKLIELIKELDKHMEIHFKFYIINGNPINGDYKLTLDTINSCALKNSHEIYEYNRSTEETWVSISECDFILSTRLHGAIFACFANTPFMLVEYHQKCTDFLKDVGYFEDYRIFDSEFDTIKVGMQICDIVYNKILYKRPLFLENMIERAYYNFNKVHI